MESMAVEVQRINKRSSDKSAALLRPVLCLTVKEEDTVILKTEADSVSEMQLSSPHAGDDTDIKSEELPETSLFHLVGTETENEPISNKGYCGENNNYGQQEIDTEAASDTQMVPVAAPSSRDGRCVVALRSNRMKFKRSVCNRKKTDDEHSVFGKFVAQELRSLHSEASKRWLKRMIQKAILEVSESDDNNQRNPAQRV